jgi:hypothetical protein
MNSGSLTPHALGNTNPICWLGLLWAAIHGKELTMSETEETSAEVEESAGQEAAAEEAADESADESGAEAE